MATLALWLALQDVRVTLELRDVPLSEAARRALTPFGHTAQWIRTPASDRRVSLSLKEADYFETLDVVCGLESPFPADSPYHPAVQRVAVCGNYLMSRRTIAVLDLQRCLRLVVARIDEGTSKPHAELSVLLPPGTPTRSCRLEKIRINGRLQDKDLVLLRSSAAAGYPVVLSCHSDVPVQRPGESFQVAGDLILEDATGVRRLPFQTDWAVLLPHPEQVEPEAPGFLTRHLNAFLLAGMALGITLILGGVASLRPAGVTN